MIYIKNQDLEMTDNPTFNQLTLTDKFATNGETINAHSMGNELGGGIYSSGDFQFDSSDRVIYMTVDTKQLTVAGGLDGTVTHGANIVLHGIDDTGTNGDLQIRAGNHGTYGSIFLKSGNDVTRVEIDKDGDTLFLDTSGDTWGQFDVSDDALNLYNRTSGAPEIRLYCAAAAAATNAQIHLYRAQGSIGSETVVASGDETGEIFFWGHDGTQYRTAGNIRCIIDGAVTGGGAADMPGRLEFQTTPDGSATLVTAMAIRETGDLELWDASGNVAMLWDRSYDQLYLYNRTYASADLSLWTADAAGFSRFFFNRGRGNIGTPTIISSLDELGAIYFRGHDGVAYQQAAAIVAMVDTTPGAGDMPGRLVLQTSLDGTVTPEARITIGSSASVRINGTSGGNTNFRIEAAANSDPHLLFEEATVTRWDIYNNNLGDDLFISLAGSKDLIRIYNPANTFNNTVFEIDTYAGQNAQIDLMVNTALAWSIFNVGATGTLTVNDGAGTHITLTTAGVLDLTGGYSCNTNAGLSGTLTVDDGANWRFSLTFVGGILTGQTTAGSFLFPACTWA